MATDSYMPKTLNAMQQPDYQFKPPSATEDSNWLSSIVDGLGGLEPGKLEGWGKLAGGIGSAGQAVTGLLSYLEGKKQFEFMKDMQLKNYEQQKNRANLAESRESDRISRHRGGGSSARTYNLERQTIAAA